MAGDWIKSNRLELQVQAKQFSDGIANLGAGLGLTTGEISGFAGTLGLYESDMEAWLVAKATADSLYETFQTDKANIESLMRKYNKRMQSASSINNAKRDEIGLPIPSAGSTVIPKTVTDVVASIKPNGDVKLKWKRNGNAPSVIFVVQTSNDGVDWSFLANATGVSMNLTGFAAGVEKWFRVVSTRGTLSATPSAAVVIYPDGEEFALSVAA